MKGDEQEPADAAMPASQQRILAAAIDAFVEQGYAGTATSEIARRAGVAEGTIFRYYPTKKALLLGAVGPLLARVLTPVARRRVKAILDADYPSAEAFVRTLAADRLAFVREHPAMIRLLVQEVAFHAELRAKFAEIVVAAFLPLLAGAISRMQARGLIAPARPESVARIIVAGVAGYAFPRVFLAPEADWDDEAELDLLARVIGRGLAP